MLIMDNKLKPLHYNINLQYEFYTKTFNNYINIPKYLAVSVHELIKLLF